MLRMIAWLIATTAVFGAVSWTAAKSASFDCAEAKAADKVAVCRDPTLSALDSEMGGLWYAYEKFPLLMGASGARRDEAERFLRRRGACGGDAGCLRKAYRKRIRTLEQRIATAIDNMAQDASAAEDQAAAAPASRLPGPVYAILEDYDRQCSELQGKLADPNAVKVMASDLDGDHEMDYVLNPEALQCSAAATAFCGNGGCRIRIALSRDDYGKPLDAMGGQPTLVQRTDATTVEIWVDRTNCPEVGAAEACWAVYSWTGAKVDRRYEARPNPD